MGLITFFLNFISSAAISISIENRKFTRFLLIFWLILCGQIVFISYFLSLFTLLTPFFFLIVSTIFTIAASYIIVKKKIMKTPDFDLRYKISQLKNDKLILIFIVAVGVITIYNLIASVAVPPTNSDGVSYHIPRYIHWLQNGNISHYFTYDYRQNEFPVNSSLLLMWTNIISNSYKLMNLIQWMSYIIVGIGIYRVGLLSKLKLFQALFSMCIYLCFPMVVLQASTVQNDLLVTSFTIVFLCFLFEYIINNTSQSMVLAGIALGLGIGTKYTIGFLAPGLIIFLIIFFLKKGVFRAKEIIIKLFSYSFIGIMIFGFYNYFQNSINYGNPFGESEVVTSHMEDNGIFNNTVRYLFQLVDFTGLPEKYQRNVAQFQVNIWDKVISQLNIEPTPWDITIRGHTTFWNVENAPHEDYASFGIIGLFLLVISPLVFLKNNLFLKGILLCSFSWFLVFENFINYSPFKTRYFVLPFALIAVSLGILYESYQRHKTIYKRVRAGLQLIIIFVSIYIGGYTSLFGSNKDIVYAITNTTNEIYSSRSSPANNLAYKILDIIVEKNSKIGLQIGRHNSEFYLISILEPKKIVYIPVKENLREVFTEYDIDYLISTSNDVNVGYTDLFENDLYTPILDTSWHIAWKDNTYLSLADWFKKKNKLEMEKNVCGIISETGNFLSSEYIELLNTCITLPESEKITNSIRKNIFINYSEGIFTQENIKKSIPNLYPDGWTKENFVLVIPVFIFGSDSANNININVDIYLSSKERLMPINILLDSKEIEYKVGDNNNILINLENINMIENETITLNFEVETYSPAKSNFGSTDNRQLGWFIKKIIYTIQ